MVILSLLLHINLVLDAEETVLFLLKVIPFKLKVDWCHVMEVESFEDEEVAKLLNDWFVSIKVDREERPDVDKASKTFLVYMTYVQALYGGGGWPLNVFVSPNLKPIMGGTYYPPDDKYGRPGFKTVLRKVKEAWETKREMLEKSGTFVIKQLSEALSTNASSQKLPDQLSEVALNLCPQQNIMKMIGGLNLKLLEENLYILYLQRSRLTLPLKLMRVGQLTSIFQLKNDAFSG
ncbi:hypothetical protein ACLOJK_017967 [Asimina triloba]